MSLSPVRSKTKAVGDDLPYNRDECLPVRPRDVGVQEPLQLLVLGDQLGLPGLRQPLRVVHQLVPSSDEARGRVGLDKVLLVLGQPPPDPGDQPQDVTGAPLPPHVATLGVVLGLGPGPATKVAISEMRERCGEDCEAINLPSDSHLTTPHETQHSP